MKLSIFLACTAIALSASISNDVLAQTDRAARLRDLHIEDRSPRNAQPGTGVIVLSARGNAHDSFGGSVTFSQLNSMTPSASSGSIPASAGVALVGLSVEGESGRREDNDGRVRIYRAYQAPPGRYVMALYASERGGTLPGRQYCFGTLAFDLAEGEVLYAGDFVNMGQPDPIVDFDLAGARLALVRAPVLQTSVRPVQYLEDIEFQCGWAAMARFKLTSSEHARLVAAGALAPAAEPVVETPAAPEPSGDSAASTVISEPDAANALPPEQGAPSEVPATTP